MRCDVMGSNRLFSNDCCDSCRAAACCAPFSSSSHVSRLAALNLRFCEHQCFCHDGLSTFKHLQSALAITLAPQLLFWGFDFLLVVFMGLAFRRAGCLLLVALRFGNLAGYLASVFCLCMFARYDYRYDPHLLPPHPCTRCHLPSCIRSCAKVRVWSSTPTPPHVFVLHLDSRCWEEMRDGSLAQFAARLILDWLLAACACSVCQRIEAAACGRAGDR